MKFWALCRKGLIWVILCMAVGVGWGTWIATRAGNAWIDFRGLYCGTRTLMHGHDPYNPGEVERELFSEDGAYPKHVNQHLQSLTLWVNLPSAFVVTAPFAAFSWGPAITLWMAVTGCAFLLAIFLMWEVGTSYAPGVATFLACVVGFNCESIFGGANAAGIVVGFCAIAAWCFLRRRYEWAGVVCLALSLAVKPHDSGFVWLYFLLAGGTMRKRALQSAAVTAAIGLASIVWVWHVAPHWLHDWDANLATIATQGGINDPGPNAVKDGSLYSIVDLESAVSIFCDDPHFYNAVSYTICGAMLLAGAVWTLKKRFSETMAWLAFAAIVPLTMLINYHRLWDAKLVMLTIPACCLLNTKENPLGKAAALITAAAALATGEISLIIFEATVNSFQWNMNGMVSKVTYALLERPACCALFAMGVFYIWVYLRRSPAAEASAGDAEVEAEPSLALH